MPTYFDSSAFVKRYVQESGTERVLEIFKDTDRVVASCLLLPEFISALNRFRREKLFSPEIYAQLKSAFFSEVRSAEIVDMTPEVIHEAINCIESVAVKTLDAIHIASANATHCNLFVTADQRQAKAAQRMKLKVEEI